MPVEIIVPRLGWSMDEGTFAEWLKRDGEVVQAGEMLFVLEGDKASQEIESFDAGLLHIPPDAPQPGETVVVGQVLGYLLAGDEPPPRGSLPRAESSPAAAATVDAPPATAPRTRTASRQFATPRARRMARELGVDWSHLQGTGRHGRIRERDILAAAADPQAGDGRTPSGIAGTPQPTSTIRRTIAQRMMAGIHDTAPVTLTTKVNAGQLVQFREGQRSRSADRIVPAYTDILMSLIATALADCPALNACWNNGNIVHYDEINLAFAVETADGLLAPVLKNVPLLSLDEITAQARRLTEQARAGQLDQQALQGGTFTITNLGMYGIDFFTPIINLPQAAILGIGRIADEPVIDNGQVVPGKTMGLSLTFDHRVVDGAPAARWLQQLATMIARVGPEFVRE